jgi:hypothetical protein
MNIQRECVTKGQKSPFFIGIGGCRLSSAIRKLSIITKIVGTITVAYLIFGFFVSPIIWIFPIIAISLLIIIHMIRGISLTIKSKNFSYIIEPVAVVAILAAIILSPVRFTGVYVRFLVERGFYVRVVEGLKGGKVELTGKNYILDSTTPLRVAFPWYGMADNWSGICYDPTGLVMKANILKRDYSNVDDPEYREAAGLYGGGLRDTYHLWGDWYYCNFT